MLINLRNALMSGKRLPYDAEVEFLESTGTQWIDTGVVPSVAGGTTFSISFAYTDSMTQASLTEKVLGSAHHKTNFPHFDLNGNYGNITLWNGGVFWKTNALFPTTMTEVTLTENNNKFYMYVNGVSVGNTNVNTGCYSDYSIYLFAINVLGTATQITSHIRLGSCKLYQNGTLVRDYIPVRKGTVGYLYDRVSGKLFGNAGTGDFVLGPDVVPVEYIESHGTEWIDTGVIASTDVSPVKIHFSPTATEQWLVGGGDSSSAGLGLRARGYDSSKISAGYGWTNALTYWNRELLPINIIGLISKRLYFNDYSANTLNFSGTYNVNFALFGQNIAGSVVPAKARIYRAEIGVCSFFPIRVGTDATSWEGAMMDVLTRRIYRNQGTGAFGYGNDLKYPIPAE